MIPPTADSSARFQLGGRRREEEARQVPTKLPMGTPSPIGPVAVPETATKGNDSVSFRRKANSNVVPSPNITNYVETRKVATACPSHLTMASAVSRPATVTATTRSSVPVTTHYVKATVPSSINRVTPGQQSTHHSTAQSSHTSSFHHSPLTGSHYSVTSGSSLKKKSTHQLRRGKWTSEEEIYAARLIHEFKSGLLPLTDGTTLRNFLSKLLNCGPMRISKKFVGHNCIGKQVFRRREADINRLTPDQIQQTRVELSNLERRFVEQVAQMNRCKTPGVAPRGHPFTGPSSAWVHFSDHIYDGPPTPPWLKAPKTYESKGNFAEMAAKSVSAPASAQQPEESALLFTSDSEKAMATIQRSSSSALDTLARTTSMSTTSFVSGD